MESIEIQLNHPDGRAENIEIPLGIQMSLMEILKGEGQPIEAICGGMALCATCKIEILNPEDVALPEPNDAELDMLDNLPCNTGNCRLSCQIQISEQLQGLKFRLPDEVLV
jgi:ferredoxin